MKAKNWLTDIICIIVGGIIWSVGINVFHVPNDIAPGGYSGLATVLHSLFNLPVGAMIAIMNIPTFIISIKKYGKDFIIKTLLSIIFTSAIIDITALFLPTFTEDMLLASIAGAAISGVGLGLIYQRDITTGGTSLLGKLIHDKFPAISFAQMILILDAIVVIIAAIAYRDWKNALYAAVAIVITEIILDIMIAGIHTGKLVYIISKENEAISQKIMTEMDRGMTALKGKGCYTKTDKEVLMVVVRKLELPHVKKIIREIDKDAFVIIGDVSEIHGEGFTDKVPHS